MTFLQLINAVLRRLRESEASAAGETEYVTLIGDLINEAKRECEDAWNWTHLRTSIDVTTSAGTTGYTLTGAGERYRILQAMNINQSCYMQQANYAWMNARQNLGTTPTGSPQYYNIQGTTSGDPNMQVYPTPTGAETLRFFCVVPQADLSATSDSLSIPSMPVILGAFAKAISERGEDAGKLYAEALQNAHTALTDAIALDAMNAREELVWTPE